MYAQKATAASRLDHKHKNPDSFILIQMVHLQPVCVLESSGKLLTMRSTRDLRVSRLEQGCLCLDGKRMSFGVENPFVERQCIIGKRKIKVLERLGKHKRLLDIVFHCRRLVDIANTGEAGFNATMPEIFACKQ